MKSINLIKKFKVLLIVVFSFVLYSCNIDETSKIVIINDLEDRELVHPENSYIYNGLEHKFWDSDTVNFSYIFDMCIFGYVGDDIVYRNRLTETLSSGEEIKLKIDVVCEKVIVLYYHHSELNYGGYTDKLTFPIYLKKFGKTEIFLSKANSRY